MLYDVFVANVHIGQVFIGLGEPCLDRSSGLVRAALVTTQVSDYVWQAISFND